MRVLFVVQRFGSEISGGSETMCRLFASQLSRRNIDVEVLTSCAQSYVDWADVHPPGTSVVEGVTVHRLPVEAPRDPALFGPLDQRTLRSGVIQPVALERQWLGMIGPVLRGLRPWLHERVRSYDLCVFFTYLYTPTTVGLPIAARWRPTIFHPTAHHEPPFYLRALQPVFSAADGFGFLTEEEALLVNRRFSLDRPSVITGIGTDLDAEGDGERFRARFGLGGRPYLLFLGRLDSGKGADELHLFFRWYKRRHETNLALVYIGDPVMPLASDEDIRVLGFVDEQTRRDAIDGCLALVQPSYFESFSMALTEAWAQRRPALVQRHCDVLLGQAMRSAGAIPFGGFEEFEVAVEWLEARDGLRTALGQAGRRYVEERYSWSVVMDRYEAFLQQVLAGGNSRR